MAQRGRRRPAGTRSRSMPTEQATHDGRAVGVGADGDRRARRRSRCRAGSVPARPASRLQPAPTRSGSAMQRRAQPPLGGQAVERVGGGARRGGGVARCRPPTRSASAAGRSPCTMAKASRSLRPDADLDAGGAVVVDHDPGDLEAEDLAADHAVLDDDVEPGVGAAGPATSSAAAAGGGDRGRRGRLGAGDERVPSTRHTAGGSANGAARRASDAGVGGGRSTHDVEARRRPRARGPGQRRPEAAVGRSSSEHPAPRVPRRTAAPPAKGRPRPEVDVAPTSDRAEVLGDEDAELGAEQRASAARDRARRQRRRRGRSARRRRYLRRPCAGRSDARTARCGRRCPPASACRCRRGGTRCRARRAARSWWSGW